MTITKVVVNVSNEIFNVFTSLVHARLANAFESSEQPMRLDSEEVCSRSSAIADGFFFSL